MERSPLQGLSAEVRNLIWEIVLCHDRPIQIRSTVWGIDDHLPDGLSSERLLIGEVQYDQSDEGVSEFYWEEVVNNRERRRVRGCLNVIATCKQLRQECTLMFYHLNTFAFCLPIDKGDGPDWLVKVWQDHIGNNNFAAMSRLTTRFDARHCNAWDYSEIFKDLMSLVKRLAGSQRVLKVEYLDKGDPEDPDAYSTLLELFSLKLEDGKTNVLKNLQSKMKEQILLRNDDHERGESEYVKEVALDYLELYGE